jgi:hypothetical protein
MDWTEYERRKKALPDDLTPEEYTAAIREICDELEIVTTETYVTTVTNRAFCNNGYFL